jgi:hypothetical protein
MRQQSPSSLHTTAADAADAVKANAAAQAKTVASFLAVPFVLLSK